MWFGDSYFVVLGEGGEEQPLLDSRCGLAMTYYVRHTALLLVVKRNSAATFKEEEERSHVWPA